MVGLLVGQVVSLLAVLACTLGKVNKLTWSKGVQLEDVLDAVQGESADSSVSAPASAHLMRVLLQLASVSLLPIEAVVSITIATLYCSLEAPRMAAVDVTEMVRLLADLTPNADKTPMKYAGTVAVCVT